MPPYLRHHLPPRSVQHPVVPFVRGPAHLRKRNAMRYANPAAKLILMIAAISLIASPALARHRHHSSGTHIGEPRERVPQPDAPEQAPPGSQTGNTQSHNVAGEFDYYALVLSWSPSFCDGGAHSDSPQCSSQTPRPYNFVLHGLWPQYQKGWPQDCPITSSTFVPGPLIDQMLDIMPAKKLIIHEYQKHGTCSGLSADAYFALARKLYTSINIPERFQNPQGPQTVSPQQVLSEFTAANPDIKPEMIVVSCGGPGNGLKEVHICMSHEGKPAACGRNENQIRLCSADSMYVPPVRGGSGSATSAGSTGWQPGQPVASAPPAKRTLSGAILQYFGKK